MLIGFNRKFAPYVEDGSKTHTIRTVRKVPPRVGEICHCYVDPRQKTMRLLGRWPCTKVESIVISKTGKIYVSQRNWVADWAARKPSQWGLVELADDERNALAYRDGFRERGFQGAYAEMMDYWRDQVPFTGQIIHWQWRSKVHFPYRAGRDVVMPAAPGSGA